MTAPPDPLRAALDAVADACPKAIEECRYFGRRTDDPADADDLAVALDTLQARLSAARAELRRAGHLPGGRE